MLSKGLILTALVFQIIGIIWDFVYHMQKGGMGEFFAAAHWPIFLGLALLLVAVIQSFPKKKDKNNIQPPPV